MARIRPPPGVDELNDAGSRERCSVVVYHMGPQGNDGDRRRGRKAIGFPADTTCPIGAWRACPIGACPACDRLPSVAEKGRAGLFKGDLGAPLKVTPAALQPQSRRVRRGRAGGLWGNVWRAQT
jgi:hypothetical protein